MNDFLTFVYFLGFVAVAGATFAYTWKLMTTTIEDFNKPIKKQNIHPEMSDVQSGEELLVFKASDNDDDDEEDVIIIRK
tara:strand:+ start:222 stop:458 length:237 start_codon:yes stop_codon:yes gene_type:complete